jgi:predicted nucleic acid-binding protein
MMSDYLLDTNILVRYLRKAEGYDNLLDTLSRDDWLYISAITRLEIVRGMQERERRETFDLLDSLETISMTREIADLAGELIRSWRAKGVILGDADAIVAASALHVGAPLVTTNARHFPMPELAVFQSDEEGHLTPRG